MKTLAFLTIAALGATSAQAATVAGLSDVTDNGGGSYTFVFDTVPADIDGTGDGLSFVGGGISFVASSDQGLMVQDHPGNGGLGVNGAPGTSDNLETGLGETIRLTFSQAVNIVNFTFNGLLAGDGHSDAADGRFNIETNGFSGFELASNFDGVGFDGVPDVVPSLCGFINEFCDTTSILFGGFAGENDSFKGYLESVTIQVSAVPVPAAFGLMLAAIGGLGAVGRKRRRS